MKKTVVIGVASGIAAFKVLDLIKILKQENLEIFVVMTQMATKMINPKEFERASGNKVYFQMFEKDFDYKKILKNRSVDHINLADNADLMVVVPATANIIGKLAHGIADDFLTTTALALTSPLVICPSMNVHMFNHPIFQENLLNLKRLGYYIVGPTEGDLACGYTGYGRLEKVEIIAKEILKILNLKKILSGKKIMVTAGATIDKIDDVRYITNKSSGKMGLAISQSCFERGAKVLLLRAKSAVKAHFDIEEKEFETAEELYLQIKNNLNNFDIIFHTAAVSDFNISNYKKGKISSNSKFTLNLNPRKKILDQIKKLNPKICLIAFKAEYGLKEDKLIKAAYQRLVESKADIIIANDVGRKDTGFQVDTNEVCVVFKDGSYEKISLDSKRNIANKIIDIIYKFI